MDTVLLRNDGLTIKDLAAIARGGAPVRITAGAYERLQKSSDLISKWVAKEEKVYGVTTGFGNLADVSISGTDARQLQKNLLMSHAAGVGSHLDSEAVRAVMALRVKDLARGHSGARPQTVQLLVDMLNAGITPAVPEKGSVGASGDLCPLAHLALVLIGLGEAYVNGERMAGAQALERCDLSPVDLESGEGLALINGTQVMTGIGGLAVYDALELGKLIDIAASISLEVLMGSRMEFDPRIHELRPHPGQARVAANMLKITRNSDIVTSHKDCSRVQDAYTLRCSPQVHGASHDAVRYAHGVVETEMNSSTGNPLVFNDTETFLTGGNFHGQPVALAMDFMCMAVAELANIAERRIERLVNPKLSGLPAFLVSDGGLNSGFMIAQYAAAALVSENKVLSHPACVDSIPTSANKEDHVSMGTISARKCREVVENTENVIAIEFLCAAQAMDLFTNLKPGEGTLAAYRVIREKIPHLDKDREMHADIRDMVSLMRSGKITAAVEEMVGQLQ